MSCLRFSIVTSLVCGLTACASAPEPILYTLNGAIAPPMTATQDQIIGLAEIGLPAYARNLQITTAVNAHQIVEDDDHRWANPPAEEIATRLRQSLQKETGAYVVERPFPSGVRPEIRLSLSIDRLLRDTLGGANLSGQYIVTVGGAAPKISRFDIRIAADDLSYESYMASLADGIDQLAIQIASDFSA